MNFFGEFTGKSAINRYNAGANKAAERMGAGRTAYRDELTQGRDKAMGQIQPYRDRGDAASSLYGNALGLGGSEARQSAFQTYNDDPFRAASNASTMRALDRTQGKYNADGRGFSGAAMTAISRQNEDMNDQRVNNWLAHLQGLGSQGQGLAQYAAGMDYGTGQALGENERNFWMGMANQDMASAAARNQYAGQGANNLMNLATQLGGMAIGGFTPGVGGVSAFGNMFGKG